MAEWIRRSAVHHADVPAQALWRTLLDGRHWHEWNADVEWMVVDTDLVSGNYMTMKPRRGRQTAYRIVEAVAPARLSLALRIGPLRAMTIAYAIEPEGNAGSSIACEVTATARFGGWLTRALVEPTASHIDDNMKRLVARASGRDDTER